MRSQIAIYAKAITVVIIETIKNKVAKSDAKVDKKLLKRYILTIFILILNLYL